MQIFKALVSLSIFLVILAGTATGDAFDPRDDGAVVRMNSENELRLEQISFPLVSEKDSIHRYIWMNEMEQGINPNYAPPYFYGKPATSLRFLGKLNQKIQIVAADDPGSSELRPIENDFNDKDSFKGSADLDGRRMDSSKVRSIGIAVEETSDEYPNASSDPGKDSSAPGIMLLSRYKSERSEDWILEYGETMDNDPKANDSVFHVNGSRTNFDPGAIAILGIGLFGLFAVIRWRIK